MNLTNQPPGLFKAGQSSSRCCNELTAGTDSQQINKAAFGCFSEVEHLSIRPTINGARTHTGLCGSLVNCGHLDPLVALAAPGRHRKPERLLRIISRSVFNRISVLFVVFNSTSKELPAWITLNHHWVPCRCLIFVRLETCYTWPGVGQREPPSPRTLGKRY